MSDPMKDLNDTIAWFKDTVLGPQPGRTDTSMSAHVLWERTYPSLLSACTVTVSVISNGRTEFTFTDPAGDEQWGEAIGSVESREVAYRIRLAHDTEDGA